MLKAFLEEKLSKYYSAKDSLDITNSYNKERKTTIRVNTIKTSLEEIKEVLSNNHITYDEVEWSSFSLVINDAKEDIVKELEIYKEGKIYLQSLSSQLPPLFVNPKKDEQILDMTAAPGGKTSEIAALADNQVMITAIEKNKIRSERLKYNIEHLGVKKTTIINTDARNLDEYFMFDKILLDAPCSGSGTLNQESMKNFSEDLINRSINFQKNLLEEAIKHIKINGEITYSTCSILKEENEEVINYILNKYHNIKLVPLDLSNYESLPKLPVTIAGTLCIKPTNYYEGFFVAKLMRIE